MLMIRTFFSLLVIADVALASDHYASDDDNIYYADYPKNTLPDLPFKSEKGFSGKLTKFTTDHPRYMEILHFKLEKASQVRPRLNRDSFLKLFKGNEDPDGARGWIINLTEENTTRPVGFIAYTYASQESYSLQPVLKPIMGKRCFEIEWYIEPEDQRKGLGSTAFDAVLQYAKIKENPKIDYLLALITPNNAVSQSFATKKGFTSLGLGGYPPRQVWVLPLS